MAKTAVILFNLGGPGKQEDIFPFLFNFFMDKNILRMPVFLRVFVAFFISFTRSRGNARKSYQKIGGKSPILENTTKQAVALEEKLSGISSDGDEYRCFVCMRYWHPRAVEVVESVREYRPDRVVLLPLYPQYSTTTTKSAFEEWNRVCDIDVPVKVIDSYHDGAGFINASIRNVSEVYLKALEETGKSPRVLFSAHGLPESIVRNGDPYQSQCEVSAGMIAKGLCNVLGVEEIGWQICYQSRVGGGKWLSPGTKDAIYEAVADGVPVIVYPVSFVNEHVETIVEIGMEYKKMANDAGIYGFYTVPTVFLSDEFISFLADLVL